jgi:hypothetical protein
MRIFEFLHHRYVVELDVEILIHAFEGPAELNVVLELHGHLVVDESLEETDIMSEHT